eukprot:1144319-Pelagomonas_calceolata.AAC.1
MGMEFLSKLMVQSKLFKLVQDNFVKPSAANGYSRVTVVWRVINLALISLQRSVCCRCATSNCRPGLVSSQYLISSRSGKAPDPSPLGYSVYLLLFYHPEDLNWKETEQIMLAFALQGSLVLDCPDPGWLLRIAAAPFASAKLPL